MTALLVGEGLHPRRLPRPARRLLGPDRWGGNAMRIPWQSVVDLPDDDRVWVRH